MSSQPADQARQCRFEIARNVFTARARMREFVQQSARECFHASQLSPMNNDATSRPLPQSCRLHSFITVMDGRMVSEIFSSLNAAGNPPESSAIDFHKS